MPCADNFFHHPKVRKVNTWSSVPRPFLVDLSSCFPDLPATLWWPADLVDQGYLPAEVARHRK
jgi:hypothetical protein